VSIGRAGLVLLGLACQGPARPQGIIQ